MTPSEAPDFAAPNPRSSPNLLPTGEAAIAMLTIGAIAAGGLYAVGKTVVKRLAISVSRKDEDKDGSDKEPKEYEKQYPVDPELFAKECDSAPALLVAAEYATDMGPSHQGASHSFSIWEKTTLDRIRGAKQRRLDQRKHSIHDVDAWYQATMAQFQHERDRRLVQLRKQGEDAARVRSLKKMREGMRIGGWIL